MLLGLVELRASVGQLLLSEGLPLGLLGAVFSVIGVGKFAFDKILKVSGLPTETGGIQQENKEAPKRTAPPEFKGDTVELSTTDLQKTFDFTKTSILSEEAY